MYQLMEAHCTPPMQRSYDEVSTKLTRYDIGTNEFMTGHVEVMTKSHRFIIGFALALFAAPIAPCPWHVKSDAKSSNANNILNL